MNNESKSNFASTKVFDPFPPLYLEVGKNLIPFVEPVEGKGRFIDELIPNLRSGYFYTTGIRIPGIYIRAEDNEKTLDPDSYLVRIRDKVVHKEKIPQKCVAVEDEKGLLSKTKKSHQKIIDPIDGRALFWVPTNKKGLKKLNFPFCWTVDEYLIIVLHRIIRHHWEEFLTLPDVYFMLDAVEVTHPRFMKNIFNEILSNTAAVILFTNTLKLLIRDGYCIRDLHLILEAIARKADMRMSPDKWAEIVKKYLKPLKSNEVGSRDAVTSKYFKIIPQSQ